MCVIIARNCLLSKDRFFNDLLNSVVRVSTEANDSTFVSVLKPEQIETANLVEQVLP